jgi:hypothetical protein
MRGLEQILALFVAAVVLSAIARALRSQRTLSRATGWRSNFAARLRLLTICQHFTRCIARECCCRGSLRSVHEKDRKSLSTLRHYFRRSQNYLRAPLSSKSALDSNLQSAIHTHTINASLPPPKGVDRGSAEFKTPQFRMVFASIISHAARTPARYNDSLSKP